MDVRITVLTGVIAVLVLACLSPTAQAEDWWSQSFEGDASPIETGVPWSDHRYNPVGGVSDGNVLSIDTLTHVDSVVGHFLWYDLSGSTYFDGSDPEGTIIEWRMKSSADPNSEFMYFDVGDGSTRYNFAIGRSGPGGPEGLAGFATGQYLMDTHDDFHTYRVKIPGDGGPAPTWVDGAYVGTHSGYANSLNGIVFGELSSSRMAAFEVDYIRWGRTKWEHSFEGDGNPIYTGVPWTQSRYSALPGATDGDIYTIDTQSHQDSIPGHFLYYNLDDPNYFDASESLVVEWRMRLDYLSDMVYLDIGDGTTVFNFAIAYNAVHGPDSSISMNTHADFHTYKLAILSGVPARMYVDGVYQGPHSGYSSSMRGIEFGDNATSRMSISYWDYIRWYTPECGDFGFLIGDIVGTDGDVPDCHVDLHDFAAVASVWLGCTDPGDSACW